MVAGICSRVLLPKNVHKKQEAESFSAVKKIEGFSMKMKHIEKGGRFFLSFVEKVHYFFLSLLFFKTIFMLYALFCNMCFIMTTRSTGRERTNWFLMPSMSLAPWWAH